MKTAIICAICQKPKRFSDSYALKLTDFVNPVVLDSANGKYTYPQKKVRVCRTCVKRMGYKVKQPKKTLK